MKKTLIALLILGTVNSAEAKPRGCLTKAEMSSDLLVRHGVFLREGADRCNERQPGGKDLWKQFDQTFGQRLRAERDRRERGFKREFPDTWLRVVTTFDARMVTFDRNLPFTDAFCEEVKSMLDDNKKKGWGSFITQSKIVRDESRMDFKPCE